MPHISFATTHLCDLSMGVVTTTSALLLVIADWCRGEDSQDFKPFPNQINNLITIDKTHLQTSCNKPKLERLIEIVTKSNYPEAVLSQSKQSSQLNTQYLSVDRSFSQH